MNCEEVKKVIDDYLDNMLDEKAKADFEDSVPFCKEQEEYLKSINSLAKKLIDLPLSFEPPKEIVSELTDKLMKMSEAEKKSKFDQATLQKIDNQSRISEKSKKQKKASKSLLKNIKISTFGGILTGMTVVMVVLVFYLISFFDDTSPWKATANQGTFKLNNELAATAEVDVDDDITSSSNSNIIIDIRERASILLDPKTSIKILKTKKSVNRLSMTEGGIEYKGISRAPNFELLVQDVKIKAMQCVFTAVIDSNGRLNVEGKEGYVEIITPYDRLLLSHNYRCSITGNVLGTPYNVNTSIKFIQQLRKVESDISNIVELTSLLYDASYKDAFTLHRLMEMVPQKNRDIIFRKLNNLYPPTPNVTKTGILGGNRKMLDEWWFEIEWQI